MGKMDDTGKALEKNINSNIEFDTSVLQEKNETYSSLTDTYGIDLFTDQYEEKIEKVHLKEYDAYQKIEKKLFETDLESGKDEYERIQDQLFLYTGSEVKKEEIEKFVNDGKVCFGMAVSQLDITVPVLMKVLMEHDSAK